MTNEKVNKARAKTTSIANQKLKPAGRMMQIKQV